MTKTAWNDALLERYDNLLNDLYLEPVSDEVLGCFLGLETNLQAPETENVVGKCNGEHKVDKGKITQVKSKDIRSMFMKVSKNIERLEGANKESLNV